MNETSKSVKKSGYDKDRYAHLKILNILSYIETTMLVSEKPLDYNGMKHLRERIEELLLDEKLVTKSGAAFVKDLSEKSARVDFCNSHYIRKSLVDCEIQCLKADLITKSEFSFFGRVKYSFAIGVLNRLSRKLTDIYKNINKEEKE